MAKKIDNFLDGEGKIKQIPSKQAMKDLLYRYLAEKFAYDIEYTEKEVNGIIDKWHTFNDYFILRRELIDGAWLMRLPDGSKYWKNKEKLEALREE